MKKIISILLSVFLICSATFTAEASDILQDLGIMTVKNDNHIVSKGEFAESIAVILNLDTQNVKSSTTFTDLSPDDLHYGAVMQLVNLNILVGSGDGTIGADKALTFNQAVKMLMCMLGYEYYATFEGGYPNGYIKLAKNIKLLDHLTPRGDGWLEEYEAAQLLLNALKAPTLKVTAMEGNGNVIYEASDTPMYEYHNLYYSEGIVNGVFGMDSTSNQMLDENRIRIDDVIYKYNNLDDTLIGQKVSFFYDSNNNIKALAPMDSNEIITIDLKDLVSVKDNYIKYYDIEREKSANLKYTKSCDIIYNSILVDSLSQEDIKNVTGTLRAISNDNSNNIDCIVIDAYKDMVVGAVDTTKNLIYDMHKDNVQDYAPLDVDESNKVVTITDRYGTLYTIDDIMIGQLISVKESIDGKYITVCFNDTEMTGTIESIKRDGFLSEITIDGEVYDATDYLFNCDVKVGSSGKFYLNQTGKIVYYSSKSNDISLGYVVRGYNRHEEYRLLIVGEDNYTYKYKLAEKVKLDDSNRNTAENIYNNLLGTDGEVEPQLIRYKLNADGEISYIETAQPFNTNKETLQKMVELSNATYLKTNFMIGTKVLISDSTKMFIIPKNVRDTDSYFITPATKALENNVKYTISAYRLDNITHTADVLVQVIDYDNVTMDINTTDFAIFDRLRKIYDEDTDEVVIEMSIVSEGVKKKVILNDASILEKVTDNNNTYTLKRGDILSYTVHPITKKVISMKLEYDYANNKIVGLTSSGSAASNMHYTYSAYAYEIAGNNMWTSNSKVTAKMDLSNLTSYNIKGIVFYDTKEDELVLGSASDIRDYVHTGISDRVFIHQRSYKPTMVYILR